MNHRLKIATLAGMALNLAACTSIAKQFGVTREAPNEFNILTKAPLSLPPEYNLRPPQIGVSNAESNYSETVARQALLGDIDYTEPTDGEIMLMNKAGVGRTDPEIRLIIDGTNSVERKSAEFTNQILYWDKGKVVDPQGTSLDPDIEAARLKSIEAATGGEKVTITRRPGKAKIPGL